MWNRRVATLVAVAASPVALSFGPWTGVAAAQDPPRPEAEDQVVLSGSVLVPRGERVGEVLVFTGSVVVNGVVEGDVVVFEGPVTIAGHVSGSVIAADGPVTLSGSARIGGDVSARNPVLQEPGAEVRGSVREDVRFSLEAEVSALGDLLGPVAVAVSVLLAGLLLLTIAPLASLAWGLLVLIGAPILAVALSVLVLGLPLGLALLLSLGFWWLVGLTIAAWCAGRALVRPPRGRSLAFLAGWAIVAAVGLVPTFNGAVWVLGAIVGLGAAVVATWRARHGGARPGGARPGRHRRGLGVPDDDAAAAGLS